jgi:hypothetical protein
MKRLTLTQQKYLEVALLFLWAEAADFTAWFTGEWKRWKRTEYNLPRMVDKGALKGVRHGKRLAYTVPGKRGRYAADVGHGLISTKALLRFKLSGDGEFVSERTFREIGAKSVPEWALIRPSRTMLLFEYSTADNFRRGQLMRKKLAAYRKHLAGIEASFGANGLVLFIFDAPGQRVKAFAQQQSQNLEPFYFVDLEAFMAVEIGRQLTAPIYFWGGDGQSYPLTSDA